MEKHRIAMVTGGSKGIGAAIAYRLAQDGFDIWLNYKSDNAAASSVSEKIGHLGMKCRLLPFDVSDPESVGTTLEPMLDEETPYVLVNNAGFARDVVMALMTQEEWRDVLSVTLDGFFLVTRSLLPNMLRKREGRIINIVSTSGQSGLPGQVNYSTAKAGLIGATKSLAAEVGRRNILVNAVSPGYIETEMTDQIPKESIIPLIPLRRFGGPDEVAGVVSFLSSDSASYITGQVISVNGGVYM